MADDYSGYHSAGDDYSAYTPAPTQGGGNTYAGYNRAPVTPKGPSFGDAVGQVAHHLSSSIIGPQATDYLGSELKTSIVDPVTNFFQDQGNQEAAFEQRMKKGVPTLGQAAVQSGKDIWNEVGTAATIATSPLTLGYGTLQHAALNRPTAEAFKAIGAPTTQLQTDWSHLSAHPVQVTPEQQADSLWNTAMWGATHEGGIPEQMFNAKLRAFEAARKATAQYNPSGFVQGLFDQRGRDTTPSAVPVQDLANHIDPANPHGTTTQGLPVHDLTNPGDPYHHAANSYATPDVSPVPDLTNPVDPTHNSLNYYNRDVGRLPVQDLTNPGYEPNPGYIDPNHTIVDGGREPEPVQAHEPEPAPEPIENTVRQNREAQNKGVMDHVQQQTAGWKNAPDIEAIHSEDALTHEDPRIREAAQNPRSMGFYDPDTGKVHIFSDRVNGPADINSVLYHESLGHYGLAQKFGDGLKALLQSFMDNDQAGFNKAVDKKLRQYNKGLPEGHPNEISHTDAAEEVLANWSESGQIKPNMMARLGAHIKRYGRQMGLNLAYDKTEIKTILAMAHDAVINGKGRDVRANGFSKGPLDLKHMYLGKYADENSTAKMIYTRGRLAMGADPDTIRAGTGYFKGPDGHLRREISDHAATVHLPRYMEEGPLHEVLHHPELYRNYPELKDIVVEHRSIPGNIAGVYYPGLKRIAVDPIADPNVKSTILHEVQHAIQDIEGHATGGNYESVMRAMSDDQLKQLRKDASDQMHKRMKDINDSLEARPNMHPAIAKTLQDEFDTLARQWHTLHHTDDFEEFVHAMPQDIKSDLYKRLLGEVEARDTEARQNYDEWDRQMAKPYSSEPKPEKGYLITKDTQKGVTQAKLKMMKDHGPVRFMNDEPVNENLDENGQRSLSYINFADQYQPRDRVPWNYNDPDIPIGSRRSPIKPANEGGIPPVGKPLKPMRSEKPEIEAAREEGRRRYDEIMFDKKPEVGEPIQYSAFGKRYNKAVQDLYDYVNRDPKLKELKDTHGRGSIAGVWDGTPQHEKLLGNYFDLHDTVSRRTNQPLADAYQAQLPKGWSVKQDYSRDVGFGEPERYLQVHDDKGNHVAAINELTQGTWDHLKSGDVHEYLRGYGRDIHANGNPGYGRNYRFMIRDDDYGHQGYEIKNLEATYEALGKDYDPGEQNWDQVRTAAIRAGTKPSEIRDLADLKNVGERMYRIGVAAQKADDRLAEIHSRIGTADERVTDQLDAVNAVADYKYFLARLAGNYTEIARALNIKKRIGFTKGQVEDIGALIAEHGDDLSELGDRDTYLKFMKQMDDMRKSGNKAGTQALMTSVASKPYWWQYALTLRQNMMLSGLSTHAKEFSDMATSGFRDFEEHVLSLPFGLLRNLANHIPGVNLKPGVHPTDLLAGLSGLADAAFDGKTWKDTYTALKHGFGDTRPNDTMTPMPQMRDITNNPIGKTIAGVADVPTNVTAALDTFFRALMHNANLRRLANEQAYAELKADSNSGNVKWSDVVARGSSIALDPTPEMLAKSHDMANQTILMNKSELNALIGQAKAIRPRMTAMQQTGSFLANLFTTFARIKANAFMNQVVRRSPLAFMDRQTLADFKEGGAKADVAMARIIMGTTLMASYWNAADPKNKQDMTGERPDSAAKRAAMEGNGWRPRAVDYKGQYQTGNQLNFSINPFDHNNNIAMMVKGMREAYEKGVQQKDLLTGLKLASYSLIHEFSSSTFAADLTPALDTFTARGESFGQKAQKFAADEARTFLPNLTTQAAKIINPEQRDTGGTIKGSLLQSTSPEKLPIKYSVYGEPMQTGTTLEGIHTPIPGMSGNHTNESTDPTIQELHRLESSVKGTVVSPVQRSMQFSVNMGDHEAKVGLKLTPEQFETYQRAAGQTIVYNVKQLMQGPDWAKATDAQKIQTVKSIEAQSKKAVREVLLQQKGWINPDQLDDLRKQVNAN